MIDSEILKSCIKQEREQQKVLYEHYYPVLMGIALRYLIDLDKSMQVVNAIFLRVFNGFPDLKNPNKFDSWIKTLLIKKVISQLKEQKHDYLIVSTVHQNKVATKEDPQRATTNFANSSTEILLKSIQALAPAYRAVQNLALIDNYSRAQISDLLEISEETTRRNLENARYHLLQNIAKLNKNNQEGGDQPSLEEVFKKAFVDFKPVNEVNHWHELKTRLEKSSRRIKFNPSLIALISILFLVGISLFIFFSPLSSDWQKDNFIEPIVAPMITIDSTLLELDESLAKTNISSIDSVMVRENPVENPTIEPSAIESNEQKKDTTKNLPEKAELPIKTDTLKKKTKVENLKEEKRLVNEQKPVKLIKDSILITAIDSSQPYREISGNSIISDSIKTNTPDTSKTFNRDTIQ